MSDTLLPIPAPDPAPAEPTPAQLEQFFEDMKNQPKDRDARWAWWCRLRDKHPWLARVLPLAAAATLGAAVCWAVCGRERAVVDAGGVESRR